MKSLLLLSIVAVVTLTACSEGTTKAKYVYKKPTGEGVAAKVGDITITHKELVSGIEADIYEEEKKIHEIKFNKLNSIIIEKLIAKDPKSKGLNPDQYLEKYIGKDIKVSDSDIQKFIKEKNIPQAHINPQIKERIRGYLQAEKRKNAVENWMGKKLKSKTVEVFFEKPRPPVFDVTVGDAPFVGGKDAKVEVVEFSDFQCPFCAKGADIITALKKKYGNKIKVAFKHFPLPFHKDAKKAAMASMCAHEQNKSAFWKMHDLMFKGQDRLGTDGLKNFASQSGIDVSKFEKCLTDHKYRDFVNRNIEEGKAIGVKSTPTFFVNGQLLQGAQPIEEFAKLIDEALK
jgi:protein-disulfide isomerase